MSLLTPTFSRAHWLAEARNSLRLARALATDPAGFVNGRCMNGSAYVHAIEDARIYRTLARHPWMTFLDVYAMGLAS